MTAPVKIPTEPAELEALLRDQDKYASMVADGTFPDVIKAYTRAVNAADKSILEQVRDQQNAFMAEFLKANPTVSADGRRLNLDPEAPPRPAGHNPKAIGAQADGLFGDIDAFLKAVHHNAQNTPETRETLAKLQNYQEQVGADGGFLVPEEFRAELLYLSLDSAIVRPRARVIPMGTATLRFPTVDVTSNASSVYGGIVVYRTEEGAELVESQASFGSIKLEATKQTALAHVTNELVKDASGALMTFVMNAFPEALAHYEDLDFISGSGAGEPLGVLAAANTALIEVAQEGGQSAGTIVWENVISMYARMLPQSLARAVWIASPDTFQELATMALSVGTGGSAVWIMDGRGTPVLTLLGRPVIMSEKAPGTIGNRGDLSFVDLSMYLIGDRQAMTIDSSEHVKFTSGKTTYRVIARNDGKPWVLNAITPANGGATLSPYVTLATRT